MDTPAATGGCPHFSEDHSASEPWHRRSLRTCAEIDEVIAGVLHELVEAGFSTRETFAVRLAVEEALANAIKHGHQDDPGKEVRLRYHITRECAIVEVQDEGPGFRPADVPDPRAPENLESDHGRGLLLMRTYMTWVRYNEAGTCVTLCKKKE